MNKVEHPDSQETLKGKSWFQKNSKIINESLGKNFLDYQKFLEFCKDHRETIQNSKGEIDLEKLYEGNLAELSEEDRKEVTSVFFLGNNPVKEDLVVFSKDEKTHAANLTKKLDAEVVELQEQSSTEQEKSIQESENKKGSVEESGEPSTKLGSVGRAFKKAQEKLQNGEPSLSTPKKPLADERPTLSSKETEDGGPEASEKEASSEATIEDDAQNPDQVWSAMVDSLEEEKLKELKVSLKEEELDWSNIDWNDPELEKYFSKEAIAQMQRLVQGERPGMGSSAEKINVDSVALAVAKLQHQRESVVRKRVEFERAKTLGSEEAIETMQQEYDAYKKAYENYKQQVGGEDLEGLDLKAFEREEALALYDAYTAQKIETQGVLQRAVTRVGEWYNKLPLAVKLSATGALLIGGVGLAASSAGLFGGAAMGGLAITKRVLGAAGAGVGTANVLSQRARKKFASETGAEQASGIVAKLTAQIENFAAAGEAELDGSLGKLDAALDRLSKSYTRSALAGVGTGFLVGGLATIPSILEYFAGDEVVAAEGISTGGESIVPSAEEASSEAVEEQVASMSTEGQEAESNIESSVVESAEEITLENGETARVLVYENEAKKSPVTYVLVHGDESVGYDTGKMAVEQYGGSFYAVDNPGERNLAGVDPNKMFGDADTTLNPLATYLESTFSQKEGIVVALHSNDPNLSFAWDSLAGYEGAETIGVQADSNVNNFVWVATPTELSGEQKDVLANVFNAQGLNIVLEDAVTEQDGSLSTWTALEGRPYFNIEVEDGHGADQERYAAALMEIVQNSDEVRAMLNIEGDFSHTTEGVSAQAGAALSPDHIIDSTDTTMNPNDVAAEANTFGSYEITVGPGDTLSQIALNTINDLKAAGVPFPEDKNDAWLADRVEDWFEHIQDVNPTKLAELGFSSGNVDVLQVGQTITIPSEALEQALNPDRAGFGPALDTDASTVSKSVATSSLETGVSAAIGEIVPGAEVYTETLESAERIAFEMQINENVRHITEASPLPAQSIMHMRMEDVLARGDTTAAYVEGLHNALEPTFGTLAEIPNHMTLQMYMSDMQALIAQSEGFSYTGTLPSGETLTIEDGKIIVTAATETQGAPVSTESIPDTTTETVRATAVEAPVPNPPVETVTESVSAQEDLHGIPTEASTQKSPAQVWAENVNMSSQENVNDMPTVESEVGTQTPAEIFAQLSEADKQAITKDNIYTMRDLHAIAHFQDVLQGESLPGDLSKMTALYMNESFDSMAEHYPKHAELLEAIFVGAEDKTGHKIYHHDSLRKSFQALAAVVEQQGKTLRFTVIAGGKRIENVEWFSCLNA